MTSVFQPRDSGKAKGSHYANADYKGPMDSDIKDIGHKDSVVNKDSVINKGSNKDFEDMAADKHYFVDFECFGHHLLVFQPQPL